MIRPKVDFEVNVEAEITPELATKPIEEIKQFKVYYGNHLVSLDELFEVEKNGSEEVLVLEGDFSRVKWVGVGMQSGEIIVKGDIGAHCGAFMKDGRIIIEGNADDWLGAEMEGGEIVVKGSAGNCVACPYWGDLEGMKGGKITIEGNAGNYIGEKMCGGEIEIKGNAGDFIGTEMKDGRIIIHGNCGYVGGDMKGGEILIGGSFELVPAFVKTEDGFVGDVNVSGQGKVKALK
ncbi:formylmethanofuran dehydrogenase subunit C [Archaeoglobus veneficus]|uniref:formylmethanofuran dehydrogenase subunit C n=1 Tax=Archaeoglobus veneficus TaxID=58290 RepID=UPI001E2BC6BC|nr:formylmethanofuran dehydrogenase subunit C [Archaeoglobus veneficus]